jgi:uncharacterized membrane protein YbhN (UPF0104 family)
MSAVALFLLAFAAFSGAFAALYFLARRLNNYGIVDVAWASAFAGLAGFHAVTPGGWGPRRALVGSHPRGGALPNMESTAARWRSRGPR